MGWLWCFWVWDICFEFFGCCYLLFVVLVLTLSWVWVAASLCLVVLVYAVWFGLVAWCFVWVLRFWFSVVLLWCFCVSVVFVLFVVLVCFGVWWFGSLVFVVFECFVSVLWWGLWFAVCCGFVRCWNVVCLSWLLGLSAAGFGVFGFCGILVLFFLVLRFD